MEAGTFQFPFAETGRKEIAAWELAVLLEGIDLSQGKRRKRYALPAATRRKRQEKQGRRRVPPKRYFHFFVRECIFFLTISDSSAMTQDMNLVEIERRIEALQHRLTQLGPMHPGSITEQYNVCGKAGCRCKDPKKPQKHGPYYQLSYTWRGKSTTRFVRPEQVGRCSERSPTTSAFANC